MRLVAEMFAFLLIVISLFQYHLVIAVVSVETVVLA